MWVSQEEGCNLDLRKSLLHLLQPAFPGLPQIDASRGTPVRTFRTAMLQNQVQGACKERNRDGGLKTSLLDILAVMWNQLLCLLHNGSYLWVRAVFPTIITLYKRLPGFLPTCSDAPEWHSKFNRSPSSWENLQGDCCPLDAVISSSLCWGSIKITKKVILSIFFLIIIVRVRDKYPTWCNVC